MPHPLRSLKLSETYQNGEEADLLEQEKKFLTEFRWSNVHVDSLIKQTGKYGINMCFCVRENIFLEIENFYRQAPEA